MSIPITMASLPFYTVDDVKNFKGKLVLVRADINTTLKDGVPQDSPRIATAAESLGELSGKGAKVVVLAHQGRFGDQDYSELEKHVEILKNKYHLQIGYMNHLVDTEAISAIRSLHDGDILVLKNVRSMKEETAKLTAEQHAEGPLVTALQKYFKYFINDAFSVSHRVNASVVGFTGIPNLAGKLFASEYENLVKARDLAARPYIFVLGGMKVDDYLGLLERYLQEDRLDFVIAVGGFGELCLMAQGTRLGAKEEFYKKKGLLDFVEKLRPLLHQYSGKFKLPVDVAIEVNRRREEVDVSELPTAHPIYDIGRVTIQKSGRVIEAAKTIFIKGPAGLYENEQFSMGSEFTVKACGRAKDKGAFVLGGGGNTTDVFDHYGRSNASYLLMAGGASMEFLAGEELPGIVALRQSHKKFEKVK